MRMCHFRAQNGLFVLNKNFLVQIFIYLLTLFTVQNLKKFLQQIQSYEDAPFLGPKWPICSNKNFVRKPASLAPFIPAYLHDKNESQILIYIDD